MRRFLAVLTGLVLISVVIAALLHVAPVRRYILTYGKDYLRKSLQIELESSELEYNLFRLSFTLHDVSIQTPQSSEPFPLLTASRVHVNLPVSALLRRSLLLEKAILEDVRIHVVVDENGNSNLPRGDGEERGADAGIPEIRFDSLEIAGKEFLYENRRHDLMIRLPEWHLSIAAPREATDHEIRFGIESPGQISLESRRLPVQNLAAVLQWRGNKLNVETIDLGLGASRLEISGKIDNLPDPVFDLKMNADLQAGEASRWAAGVEDFSGELRIEAQFEGSLDAPNLSARLLGRALSFGIYKAIDLETALAWDPHTGVAALNSLAVRSPIGNLKGDASIATTSGDSSANLTFNNLDLGKISQGFLPDLTVTGMADGKIEARCPGMEWQAADVRADFRIAGGGKVSERTIPVEGRIELATRAGNLQAFIRRLKIMGAGAEGLLTFDKKTRAVGGTLRINADDLSGSVGQINRFLGRDPAAVPISGSVRMDAELSGTLDEPAVTAELWGETLGFERIKDISLHTKVLFDPRRIRIEQTSLEWLGQRLQASGEIGLVKDPPEMHLEIQGEKITLARLLSHFVEAPPIDGTVDFIAQVTGPVNRPSASLQLQGAGMRTLDKQWGDFHATASLEGGHIKIDELTLGSPGAADHFTASGFFNLESREYSFEAKADLELRDLGLPIGSNVSGRLYSEMNGSGSMSNPAAEVIAEVSDLTLDSYRLGDCRLDAHISDRRAELQLQADDLGLSGGVQLSLHSPFDGIFNAVIDIPELTVLGLRGPDGEAISGVLEGTLQGSGPLSTWQSLDARIRLEKFSAVVNRQEIDSVTPVEVGLSNGTVRVTPSRIRVGEAHLEMAGSLPLEAGKSTGGEFLVDVKGNLESLHGYFPDLGGMSAKGDVHAIARIRGGLDLPEPSLELTLKNGEVGVPEIPGPFHNIEMEVETRDNEIVLGRLSANWNGAELTASATIPLGLLIQRLKSEVPSEATFHATVSNLNPAEVPGAPEGLGGSIAMRMEGSASGLNLSDLAIRIDFDTLRLQKGNTLFEQAEVSHISLHKGLLAIDRFEMAGSGILLSLAGNARLDGAQEIDIRLKGKSDAGLFSSLVEDVRAAGPVEFELALSGTIPDHRLSGTLLVQDGWISAQNIPVQGENISLSLQLHPGSIEVVHASGILNGGGRFEASGNVTYGENGIGDIDLSLNADNVNMDFPEGLRTISNSRIRVRSQGDLIMVEGNVTLTDGSFRDELEISRFISSNGIQFVEERDPFLSRLRFNVKIETDRPITVFNRQAELMVDSELTLVGTFYKPSVTGRLTLEEGGEIYLAEHRYVVDTGIVSFVNESRIEPVINLLARTQSSGYDINLTIQGSPGRMDTSFTSDPSLPEPDIISLLLTGRTLDEARGSGLNIAQQHAISYLTGQLGGRFSRTAEQTLGLSRIRIEPNLVSGDSDPSARLTVGQDLRRDLRLIYSMNLADSSDQILIGEYDLTRRFTFRGTNQYDNSRRFDFQHDLRFGGQRFEKGRRNTELSIGEVSFRGDRFYPDEVLAEKLGVRKGKSYDFFQVRKGLDRLEKHYSNSDYLEARIRLQQDQREKEFDISVDIDAGHPVRFVYEGFDLPKSARKQVRRIWKEGVFDLQRSQDGAAFIKSWFIRNRYYEAAVQCKIRDSSIEAKEVGVYMIPGTRYTELLMQFNGADGIQPARLEQIIRKEKNGIVDSMVYPKKVVDLLTQYYRQQGYSTAQIDPPRTQLDPDMLTATLIFKVREGPLFRIGSVGFDGNQAISDEDLQAVVVMSPGAVFHPGPLRTSIDKLEEIYWGRGYNNVRIESRTERDLQRGEVDIRFQIDEQDQDVIRRIEIAGNNYVDDGFIRKHLRLNEGEVLDHTKTELSRRALYKTGSFELVELEAETLATFSDDIAASRSPLLLRARVREVVPYKIRYGGFYDTDRGPGAIFDFENRNSLLGGARLLGFRGRYDADLKEARGYFGQPLHLKFPSVASATVFYREESFESSTTDTIGVSLQHEMELRENMVLSYGYRFEKTDTSMHEPNILSLPDTTWNVAPLTASFSWDTRDELLDATRGFFISNTLQYAPSLLGSDLRYMKYFGQVFKYLPLSLPSQVPFGRGIKRPRFVYAGGVRIGLAGGFDNQDLPESERFFAGGGTSIRGFDQNSIGPVNELGDPVGGEAVFMVNNELRVPLKSIFEGVGFLDFGNVYPRIGDFNPFDVRGSFGPGIRLRTPYFLLRFDYGIKLDRRPGERVGDFYFSIGQAF